MPFGFVKGEDFPGLSASEHGSFSELSTDSEERKPWATAVSSYSLRELYRFTLIKTKLEVP